MMHSNRFNSQEEVGAQYQWGNQLQVFLPHSFHGRVSVRLS
jgi:hypothetical protein